MTNDQHIGEFFWYSIPPGHVSLERVRRAWRTARLPVDRLPKSRKPADVAAEACSHVGAEMRWVIEQTENSKQRLTYSVERKEKLPTALVFDKPTAAFTCLDPEVCKRVEDFYESHTSKLPSPNQRQAVRDLLVDEGAENVHVSIYFMPIQSEPLLRRVEAMLSSLYPASEFHRVEVHPTPRQVAYLSAKMVQTLTHEMRVLTAELRVMTNEERPRKWRRDKIESLGREEDALNERWGRFRSLLDDPMPAVGEASEHMLTAMTELLVSVEDPLIV